MTTLKEKSVKKPFSEEAKKERAAKARATRQRHKMEILYSEFQLDFSMEEKTMCEQKPEEEKEETVLQWDRLRKKREQKATNLQPQLFQWQRGGREPPKMKKKILMMLPQTMISMKVETRNPPPKH
jgi:hypothetical protein